MTHKDVDMSQFVEVTLKNNNDFLVVRETLTRIGFAGDNNKLVQTCHIFHKRGKYYIVHFKELFIIDGKNSTLDKNDIRRRNGIARLLQKWGLVNIVDESKTEDESLERLRIIPFTEKENWTLVSKYDIGKKKPRNTRNGKYG